MDIIEALKQNEKPFGLMSAEMQAKAEEIKLVNFLRRFGGTWYPAKTDFFGTDLTYCLHPDYTEEPKIEKVGLEMKYFVLKPKSKSRCDVYSEASQAAMITYAETIEDENPTLAKELKLWAKKEANDQMTVHPF